MYDYKTHFDCLQGSASIYLLFSGLWNLWLSKRYGKVSPTGASLAFACHLSRPASSQAKALREAQVRMESS